MSREGDVAGAEHLIVARVRKPHGIRGELSVQVETDRPGVVFRPGRVLLVADARGRPSGETLTVERTRPFKGGLLLKAAEHAGLTPEVEALRGRTLVARRDELETEAGADEPFYHELVGMRVEAGGETVGTVRELFEAPAGLLLEVRREGRHPLLLPYVDEVVRRVDREAGVVEIDPPPGLLDL